MADLKESLQKYWIPVLIIILTIAARLYHLGFQSLWFDELYSMTIAAPTQDPSDIFIDIKTDFHPPLYYLFLNFIFKFIPYSDVAGRLISAIAGCLSIGLIYMLGTKIRNKYTGLSLALFFSVFFYHIKYSQEIRMYIFLFAFAIMTSLLFLKYLKEQKLIHLLLYVFISAITIYTQYYGFFIMLAQGLCLLHLLLVRQIRIPVFRNFIFAYIGVFLLYLPWLPMLFQTGSRQHFIELPSILYFFEYLYEYTGKEPVTTIFIFTGLGLYIKTAVRKLKESGLNQSPFQLLVAYSVLSIFVITYIVSIFKPMLSKHSTLAGLPFLLVMVFTGYQSLKGKWMNPILFIVVLANILNLLFISRYYTKDSKENFRQITEIVINDNVAEINLLIVSQLSKFYNYYFEQKGSTFRAQNPNEIQPSMLSDTANIILVINAPFTEEKTNQLEPVNALGFQILNPRLLHKTDSINEYCKMWNSYLMENYMIDTIYTHPTRNIPIAFKFINNASRQN